MASEWFLYWLYTVWPCCKLLSHGWIVYYSAVKPYWWSYKKQVNVAWLVMASFIADFAVNYLTQFRPLSLAYHLSCIVICDSVSVLLSLQLGIVLQRAKMWYKLFMLFQYICKSFKILLIWMLKKLLLDWNGFVHAAVYVMNVNCRKVVVSWSIQLMLRSCWESA